MRSHSPSPIFPRVSFWWSCCCITLFICSVLQSSSALSFGSTRRRTTPTLPTTTTSNTADSPAGNRGQTQHDLREKFRLQSRSLFVKRPILQFLSSASATRLQATSSSELQRRKERGRKVAASESSASLPLSTSSLSSVKETETPLDSSKKSAVEKKKRKTLSAVKAATPLPSSPSPTVTPAATAAAVKRKSKSSPKTHQPPSPAASPEPSPATSVTTSPALASKQYSENSVVKRLKRASVRASTEAAAKHKVQEQIYASSMSASASSKSDIKNNNSDRSSSSSSKTKNNAPNLLDLMQVIDRELQRNQQYYYARGMNMNLAAGPQPRGDDSMGAVLVHNLKQDEEQNGDDALAASAGASPTSANNHDDNESSPPTRREVAVLLAKPLQNDDITFEGAGRIRLLVKLIKENNYRPDVICFVGTSINNNNKSPQLGTTNNNNRVADADASYIFFRHLCASQRVLGVVESCSHIFLVKQRSMDQDALLEIVQHISQNFLMDWRQEHTAWLSKNIENYETRLPRKRLHIHFSLISSEYELCQLNDIHTRSPNQSALRVLSNNNNLLPTSWVKTTWSYHYTTTATAFSDPVRSFAAKTYKTAQDLVPVLKNLRGVVDNREFFQRDNYRVLVAARRSLVSDMENMYHKQPSLHSVRKVCLIAGKPLDVVLEGALLGLGRCLDLVRPAGLLTGSVPRDDFRRALTSLQQAYYLLDRACDPDEPLNPADWGKLASNHDSNDSIIEEEELEEMVTYDDVVLEGSTIEEENGLHSNSDIVVKGGGATSVVPGTFHPTSHSDDDDNEGSGVNDVDPFELDRKERYTFDEDAYVEELIDEFYGRKGDNDNDEEFDEFAFMDEDEEFGDLLLSHNANQS